jgi:hypothetical protein
LKIIIIKVVVHVGAVKIYVAAVAVAGLIFF